MTFDKDQLISNLGELPPRRRLAFAAACASRMRRCFKLASAGLSLPDPDIVGVALDHIWSYLKQSGSFDWPRLENALADQIPDEDVNVTPAHWVADDALAAAAYAVRTAVACDPKAATAAASRNCDAADAFAQYDLRVDAFTALNQERLRQHPVLLMELRRQSRDLAELSGRSEEGFDRFLDVLRGRSEREDVIPLDGLQHWIDETRGG